MAKFCRYCGNPVREGANFCKTCGAQLNTPNHTSASVRRSAYPAEPRTTSSRVGVHTSQPKKKKNPAATIAVALVIVLVVTGFGWPGWLRTLIRGGGDNAEIHTVEILLPASTGARAVVEQEAAVAVEAYLVACAYYDKLQHYDLDEFDPDEYAELFDRTVTAFEIADELSAALEEDAAFLSELEDTGKTTYTGLATYRELSAGMGPHDPFAVTAYAAEESPAVKWAKDITSTFDSAPAGRGIRTLAAEMGTDAKHAYAALQQAQNILEGAANEDEAAFWNKAYQAAVTTKAVATTAGVVVATAASGGAAAGLATVLETGGIVCGTAQAVLDTGTALTVLATDGEGNEYTEAFEKTSSQFAPVSAVFSLGNAGVNIYNMYKGVDVGDNAAQALIYIGNSITDYVTGKTVLGGALTNTNEGWKFTLMDTLFGTEPAQQEATKTVLREVGVKEEVIDEAIELALDEKPSEPKSWSEKGLGDAADEYIDQWDIFTDPDEPFDMPGYTSFVREELSHYGTSYGDVDRPTVMEPGLHVDSDDEYWDDEDTPEPEPTDTPEPTPSPDDEEAPAYDEGFVISDAPPVYIDKVSGVYQMSVDRPYSSVNMHDSFEADVFLDEDFNMEISFRCHALVVADDFSMYIDMDTYEDHTYHLVGTYDPPTGIFLGQGNGDASDFWTASTWDAYPTRITFRESNDGTTASGQLGYTIDTSDTLTSSLITDISMVKIN